MVQKVKPVGMLLMMLAEWVNRHRQDVAVKLRVSQVHLIRTIGRGSDCVGVYVS